MTELDIKKKKAAYMKQYYRDNPDKAKAHREWRKQYFKDNPEAYEKYLQQARDWYQLKKENKEISLQRAKEYYKINSQKIKTKEAFRHYNVKLAAVMKLGGICMRCGFGEHPAALQFHHREPKDKLFNITTKQLLSSKFTEEMVEMELSKCDLLCANCHFIVESAWPVD